MTLPAHVADIHLRTTPAQLWAALTRPELTRRWYFRLAAESSWAVGTPVVYRDASGRPQVEGEVLEVVPGRMLVTSASFLFHPQARREPPVRMTWEITPLGEVCQLTVRHDGLNSGPATATLLGALPIALGNLRSLLEIGRLLPIQTVTFDCAEPARLAAFWQEVTGYVPLDPGDGGAALIEPHGLGPRLKFNKVPEPKTVKNWVHLDIIVEDMMVAVERLVALGGRVLWTLDGSTVLADPEGNEFCIFS
jgi:uncharacterized protein YndB with AHSA1/START domain